MFSAFNYNHTITDSLRNYINRKVASFGRIKYAYMVISKKNPSDFLAISNYPREWVKIYRTNNFQFTDPVILTAFRRTSPFLWDENVTIMSNAKFTRVFSLSRRYNIVNGFTFVLHDHMNNLALLSFIISNKEQSDLSTQLFSERGAIQLSLIDINEHMYNLAGTNSYGRKSHYADSEKPILTQRENEMLYWSSMGKTYGEIAFIAGISVRTVKFHMGNIVSKLGVCNVRQAIRLSTEMELIKPIATGASL